MTEEIIIDGVDVAGCTYFQQEDDEYTCGAEECNGAVVGCRACNNCYYKQLKRLEQENRELRKANEISIEKVTITAEAKRLQELEQENKELKEVKEQLKKWNDENLKRQDDMQMWIDLAEEQRKNYRSALEEIREVAIGGADVNDCTFCYSIFKKINEVLNEKEL